LNNFINSLIQISKRRLAWKLKKHRKKSSSTKTQKNRNLNKRPLKRNRTREIGQEAKANNREDRSSFVHGLSVGLGLGCIATFIIIWVVVFFTPQIPSTLTYESMFSMFIYPMLYLLVVGLVALTAGIVREYYVRR
jgi:hypothetical protein